MEIGRVSRLAGVVLALISITTTWSRHGCCVAELYTALADMEELLETEAVLIDTLNGYIKAQEERLATLRK
ncbi:prolyl 4-hydroxylase subunit alpha-1 isoform X2 [Apis mellifera caucasica]|nr:prolyl 4-hydroxylase subunit alpha-1 isoform X2 [Apis mellifera caucasica]KAG9433533.1 prolyl 4-hydroxylase subunit alpha-1 isoform X2 [Apis mellifera carnica]